MSGDKTTRIAKLNDQLRAALTDPGIALQVRGLIVSTCGIIELPHDVQIEIRNTVAEFQDFDEGDDPYGERDFGAFDHPIAGKVFWKIDYYNDRCMNFGSEAPEDPNRCFRVLTIMLANEY